MPLFQKSVENKYLNNLAGNKLKLAYDRFKKVYGNDEQLENIRLPKEKKSISPAKLNELTTYYEEYKSKALDIQAIIDRTDNEIDQMVYELYGLTEEEIKIVEGAG